MAIAKCGGLVLDGSTLKMVNGIITVASGNPTSDVVANCGGVLFDATYFKKIGKVITDKNATSVSVIMTADCGGLLLDAAHFNMVDGKLVFDKLDSDADITKFVVAGVEATISGTDITAEVPNGTDVTKLKPTITISKDATVAPKSGAETDFTDPVSYVVTAEDDTTKKTYTVTITVAEA
jgi:accessory colonization factor AcfC